MKRLLFLIGITFLLDSCFTGKLVYMDEWEGDYDLRKNDYCCDTVTNVRLSVTRNQVDKYQWKLFFIGGQNKDTIYGEAYYVKNQLSFFVENVEVATSFFVRPVNRNSAVFGLVYSNYHSDKKFRYISYGTRWHNEMKSYKRSKGIMGGGSYSFKNDRISNKIKIPK